MTTSIHHLLCPWCNSRRHVEPSGDNSHTYACRKCGRQFEDEDDGDVGYGRPSKRIEREERASERKQQHAARMQNHGHRR